jgi:SPP1 family phage portal protein
MLVAETYYKNKNTEMTDRKIYYIDRKGNKKEATNLSNTKLRHPFMKKLVNQKVNYLLSKPFSVKCEDENFTADLMKYLDDDFMMMIKNVGKHAIIKALSWVQVYYNENGELKFKRIPTEEVLPFWKDADHTDLEALMRFYDVVEYDEDGNTKTVTHVEYYTIKGVWYYILGDSGLKPDPQYGDTPEKASRGHFRISQPATKLNAVGEEEVTVDENGNPVFNEFEANWDRIPFICFKYNSDEISLLDWVKDLIDDYDVTRADTSNLLKDAPNSIKVVKNYDGTDKEEFTQNLSVFRIAFVSGDGEVTKVETSVDIESREKHVERLRKDIFAAGCGVDTQTEDLGNSSGVSLEYRYSDLDGDSQDMASEFKAGLKNLVWFIKVDMKNTGMGDYLDSKFEIVFNTDIIVNETEIITACKDSAGIISDETIIANHPWVTDPSKELLKRDEEQKKKTEEAMRLATTSNPDFGFGQKTNPDDPNTLKSGDE